MTVKEICKKYSEEERTIKLGYIAAEEKHSFFWIAYGVPLDDYKTTISFEELPHANSLYKVMVPKNRDHLELGVELHAVIQ